MASNAHFCKTSALVGGLAPLLLLGLTTPAFAQTSPDAGMPAPASSPLVQATPDKADANEDQAIIVTGTRISRPDLQASSPVAVISGEAFKTQNAVTVEELLNTNPQFVPSGTANSNNPGDGAATVDLRGLGSNRTLVLIDGKRAPTYDVTGSVDVNAIPTALLKRVDVLTGGASAVYGSDAVAGVVNFILDDRFTGLKFDGSSQVTGMGDGPTQDLSLTGGLKLGDRGNIVATVDYSRREGIKFSARPKLGQEGDSFTADPTSINGLGTSGSSNTTPTYFSNQGLQVTDAAGDLAPYYQPYNTNLVNYAYTPLERYNAMVLGRYELTDHIEAYGRASYEHVKTITTLAPTATAGFPFNISPENPYLSADEREAFFDVAANPGLIINPDGSSVIDIRRRITETGGRIEDHTTETYQFVGGLRGDINNDFKFDIFGQYGRVKKDEVLQNDISYTALTQSLDAVIGANGVIQCRDTSNGCVPTNLFSTTPISSAALAFFIKNAHQDNTITQIVTGGNVSGNLTFLKSPFAEGAAAISVGVEYRREQGTQTVDPEFASGDLIYYGQGQNAKGSYDTKEAYIEFKMPLVQDRPFFKSLDLEAGFRYSDYSTVGSVYTYKGGGDWSPVDGLRFRAIYQRAVRAPNLYELYSTAAAATGNLNTDPCAGSGVTAASTTGQLCIAQIEAGQKATNGTTDPVRAASLIGTIPDPVLGQINVFVEGNPTLQAEKTNTITLGVVINPPQLRAFSLSVDYYHIKIANAVDTQAAGATIDNCFNVEQSATAFDCAGTIRNPVDGSLSGLTIYGVPQTYANLDKITTSGIDVDVGYHGGSRGGFNYAASFAGTYVRSFVKAGDQCAGLFGDICGYEPLPKWKHTGTLTLGYGAVDFNTRWRFIGKIHGDADMVGIVNYKIKAYSYIDETVSFNVGKGYTLRLGVSNLFNKQPPIVGDTAGAIAELGNTFPDVYDVLGRTLFASVSAKF